jgi:hypothetical protein
MTEFAQLTKETFEAYHNIPYEPAVWGFTDAVGHIMEFLAHHDSIDEMPGLREAMYTMTPGDWENWRKRYPEHRLGIIDPLYREIAERSR